MLFNKMIGRRLSIVEDTPGVTRDRMYGECEWRNRKFDLVDTGGIEPRTDNQILAFMRSQAQIAIDNATVIVFLCDIKTGMTASDQEVANMLQRCGKPVILAVNKVDQGRSPDIYEFYNLGLGDPIAVSAVHGHGTGDLLDACVQYFPRRTRRKRRMTPSRWRSSASPTPASPPGEQDLGGGAGHRVQRGGHHPRRHRLPLHQR